MYLPNPHIIMNAKKSELAISIEALEKINTKVVCGETKEFTNDDVEVIKGLRSIVAENVENITIDQVNQMVTIINILLNRGNYNFHLTEEDIELLTSFSDLLKTIRDSINKVLDRR